MQQKGDPATKLNIIAIPVGFTDMSQYTSILNQIFFVGATGDHAGLLATEPFSNYTDKINISYFDTNIDENYFDCKTVDNPKPMPGRPSQQYTCDIPKVKNIYQTFPADQVVLVINNRPGDSFGGSGVLSLNLSNESSGLVGVFVHEFGHAFGGLADEYDYGEGFESYVDSTPSSFDDTYQSIKNFPNIDTIGCPKWCQSYDLNKLRALNSNCGSFTTQQSCEAGRPQNMCLWFGTKNPFFQTNCVSPATSNSNDMVNIGLNCQTNTGCYYGAAFGSLSFRSQPRNLMMAITSDGQYAPPAKDSMSQALDCCFPKNSSTSCQNFLGGLQQKYLNREKLDTALTTIAFCGDTRPVLASPITEVVKVNDTIFGFYSVNSAKTGDWLALYDSPPNTPPGSNSTQYSDWKWLNNSYTMPTTVNNSGIFQFTTKSTESGYGYSIQYFVGQSFPFVQTPYRSIGSTVVTNGSVVNVTPSSSAPNPNACQSLILAIGSTIKTDADVYYNWGGLYEKWFRGKNNSWYYMFNIVNGDKPHTLVMKENTNGLGLQAGGGQIKGDTFVAESNADCYLGLTGNYQFPSNPIQILASITQQPAGQSFNIFYAGIPAPTTTDWVGIYQTGTVLDTAFKDWVYVKHDGSCTKTPGDGNNYGSCQYTPTPMNILTPGTYELRLFSNNGYTKLSTSVPFTILPPLPPTISANTHPPVSGKASFAMDYSNIFSPTTSDWVGIYTPGTADTAYKDWMFLVSTGVPCTKNPGDAKNSGSCVYTVPDNLISGNYEVRLFTNGFTKLATTTLSF